VALAVCGVAGATTIPFTHAWNGPVYMHAHGYTQGTVYSGFLVDGNAAPTNVWLQPGGGKASDGNVYAALDIFSPSKASKPGEDGWSIIQIDSIFEGKLVGTNNITPQNLANPLFFTGFNNKELVGASFNRNDLWVKFNGGGEQEFLGNGETFELFVQPVGTFDDGNAGSAGRILNDNGTPLDTTDDFYEDKYVTAGYLSDGTADGNATLVLSGNGEPGYYPAGYDPNLDGPMGDPNTEFAGDFTPAGTSGSGDYDTYYTITGGADAVQFGTSDPFVPNRPNLGGIFNNADLRLHVTNSPVTQDGEFDWLVSFSDPITGDVIPEPLTALTVLGSAAGLAGYVRRRRRR
jgi:hypothetical protein